MGKKLIFYRRTVSIRWRLAAIAAGLGAAALYTFSPLTICAIAVAAAALPAAFNGLRPGERRWLTVVIVAAAMVRVAAIGAIFLRNVPMHDDQFVGAASGDEAYVMSRALRVRDILRGGPAGKYDFFVAYDEYGRNSYVSLVSALQVIFGPTPYALRVVNALVFTAAALLLFRLARDAFGPVPALAGLALLLFWPTLFAWSISLLKEPLYLLGGTLALVGAIRSARAAAWGGERVAWLLAAVAGALLIADLRPAALPLAAAGIGGGLAAFAALQSRRAFLVSIAAGAATLAVLLSARVEPRVVGALTSAAKVHTGHVFTVGHSYKLLDDGFYLNPATPAASKLTLTRDEAARFVVRAAASFFLVPLPWQLQSMRELAFMPEQLVWYALIVLIPVGIAAGCRRDRLVACMLVGYVVPTMAALALTNGNVGTLVRLRGLVIPYVVWIGALGFCAVLGAAGRKPFMPLIDDNGRVFGRVNLFDAAIAASVVVLAAVAFGTFLLFRPAAPRITSVTRVPITNEERRVAGGSRLTAKLKVRGSGLRPMLRASIGSMPALGFVFEDPNSADVLVGEVPAGAHDLVLYDGVQEVARFPRSVTIESAPPPHVVGIGTLVRLDKSVATALQPGALAADVDIRRLGTPRPAADGWQRAAAVLLQCDPDPHDEGCAVGGVPLRTDPPPTLRLPSVGGSSMHLAIEELLPAEPPAVRTAVVRLTSAPELLNQIREGDRDDVLDERAAAVVHIGNRRAGGADVDVTVRLGLDRSAEGWRYRGRVVKAGARFVLTTERYVMEGVVLKLNEAGEVTP